MACNCYKPVVTVSNRRHDLLFSCLYQHFKGFSKNFVKMNRFGTATEEEININVQKSEPENTVKSKKSIWKQFMSFCTEKNYTLNENTAVSQLSSILKDWAFNMRKRNGEEYKDYTVKTIWNVTAKLLMEKYFNEYGIKINPFEQIEFKSARDAKAAKRRNLQYSEDKRKQSAAFLTYNQLKTLIDNCDEETPGGLQKKVFFTLSYELAWRGGEGGRAKMVFFKEEVDISGTKTGRISYNPVFTKTTQGGEKKCADPKWLIKNNSNRSICPVRLFLKLQEKRGNPSTERLFLTVNPFWQSSGKWYKNSPVGPNEISKWTKSQAMQVGMKNNKNISNHSLRATAVSKLAKSGVSEQNLIKITGHSNPKSVSSYIQMDEDHHKSIIEKMRETSVEPAVNNPCSSSMSMSTKSHQNVIHNYHGCNFYYTINNK